MKKYKSICIVIFLIIVIPMNYFSSGLMAKDDKCDPEPPEDFLGGDRPDDNYSYSNGSARVYNLAPEAVILTRGYWENALKLYGGLQFDGNNSAEKLFEVTPFLILPSGALESLENDSFSKYFLEEYVKMGGTLIVFAQQYGDHIKNVIPGGKSLKFYGWREDQSCLRNSIYFDTMHPILSSSTSELISAGVDGYFSVYPSNTTILLKRKLNLEPAMLYYPYGEGTVILTSLYTDWASSHSQATTFERRIIRDVITFAKNPRIPIPMYNLEENPTPDINLNVVITNNTEELAAKAKFVVYTPDKKTRLYETEAGVSLSAGQSTTIPIHFTLPEMDHKDYGICHVNYDLLDAEDELIQMKTESDSGRFATYNITTHTTIGSGLYQWLTVKDEKVYWGQNIECTIHFKNTTDEPRTLEVDNPFFNIGHGSYGGSPFPSFQVTVPPGGEYAHLATKSTTQYYPYTKMSLTFRIQYYDSNGVLKQLGQAKRVFLMGTATKSNLKLNTSSPILPGGSINYVIDSDFVSKAMPGNSSIKLTLEMFSYQGGGYTEIKTLYQTEHDYQTNGRFHYSDTYTPQSPHPNGLYRLKLEVRTPDGLKEKDRYYFFHYDRSGFHVKLEKVQKDNVDVNRLIPGQSYTIPIKIKNELRNNYNVKNGRYLLVLESDSGEEIYRKQVNNINISSGGEKDLFETFVFTPTQLGAYTLKYRYWDETCEEPSHFLEAQRFFLWTNVSVKPDKRVYEYPEIANVGVTISGIGSYNIHFVCPEAGIDEIRNIYIPEGTFFITEFFQIPTGMISVYNVNVEVKDSLNITKSRSAKLFVDFPEFDYKGIFDKTFAIAGADLHLNLYIKGISGMSSPLSGQLSVTCAPLNYENTQTVTLQPGVDNSFTFTIPISADAAAGTYQFETAFKIAEANYINKQHTIYLPGAEAAFTAPDTAYNAGDTITFNMENIGGKEGQFDIELLLKDSTNIEVVEHKQTHIIGPGVQDTLSLNLPDTLKTDTYQLIAEATETVTGKKTENTYPISITGLNVLLNSYTLEEKYFDTQVVTGKSEITNSTRALENGILNARIVKLEQVQAIEAIYGRINCLTKDTQNRLWAGTSSGLAFRQGDQWQEITQLPDGTPLVEIRTLAAAPNHKIYALTFDNILEIDDRLPTQVTVIPFRYGSWDSCATIGVDEQSRLWAVYSGEWHTACYYDSTAGSWPSVHYGTFKEIVSDQSGGIWIAGYNSLTHIKSDLSVEEINPYNSSMPDGEIQSLFVDPNRILWVVISQTLYRFNGVSWTNLSSYTGYPLNGIKAVIGDESNNIYAVGINPNYYHSLYHVGSQELVRIESEFYARESFDQLHDLVVMDSYVYTYGSFGNFGEGGQSSTGLLKIGLNAGNASQTAWEQTYPVTLSPGTPLTLDLDTAKTFAPGFYLLETHLLSPLQQVLAESSKTFIVRGSDISVCVSGETTFQGMVKPGENLPLSVEVLNNTSETQTGLTLIITKISPSGTEEEISIETFSLSPGELLTRGIVFNEDAAGTWRLMVQLLGTSSGGGGGGEGEGEPIPGFPEGGPNPFTPPFQEGDPGTTPVVISETELLIQVTVPAVSMQILAPPYAGNDPVDVKFKLLNDSDIRAQVHALAEVIDEGEVKLDETLLLNPGEERIFSFIDTISSDRTYTFTLSGDVQKSQTFAITYGYVEQFTLDALPSYREGTVTIGYNISNSGGLTFRDVIHFELFSVGSSAPLYTMDRSYLLYPNEPAVIDSLQFPLVPGNYQLTYSTTQSPTPQEVFFMVQPSGIGTVTFSGSLYPIGMNELSFQVTNTDTVAGQIPVTLTLTGSQPGVPLLSETRSYYLAPGETTADFLHYEFTQKGNYTLTFTGAKLPAPVNAVIQVLNNHEVSAQLTVGIPEGSQIPVAVDITNSGYNPFSGTLEIEVSGIRYEYPVNVSTASSFAQEFGFETAALTPGSKEVKVFLYDTYGNIVSQATAAAAILPADLQVVEIPENLEIDAGSYADVTLKLRNNGHLRGEAMLKVSAFDSLYQEREIALEPGQEIEISELYIEAPSDLPTGFYPFNYTLTGSGVVNGVKADNFTFKVNGLSLAVDATLDRSLYNEGETAQLTLNITSPTTSSAPLEAVVNWGEFSERLSFTLSSGSASLVFDIPLDEKREEKIFYGIYHEGGKGIHLNDIYLHFKGVVSVETDQQVYEPGETIQAVFSSDQGGILTAEAFGESHTLTLSSSASATFLVPNDTPGGTYGISWNFVPSESSQEEHSGSYPFDVSGLVVKVAKSELEKGKYTPGETIKAAFTFESNRDDTLELRCWVMAPSNEWQYLGESSVTVSADRHVNAVTSYAFNTSEAGTHELIYGLYKLSDQDQLIVSGRLAFDVGDAVLMGITTDFFEYQQGNENVMVTIDYFGEGTAQLEMYLDDELVNTQSLSINGVGRTEISLTSSQISGGSHSLKVILTKDGLTSTKTTSFIYGTLLPDLVVTLAESLREGLDYTYKVEVSNNGKTASAATTLVFIDNGTTVETLSIPSLQPGTSHESTINWSGSGKAGTHEFVFEVDPGHAVKEFSESNNRIDFTEEVPVIFYTLEVDPVIWPANSDITIITRLINNQSSITPVTLNLSLTNDSTNEVIFQRAHVEELPAFGSKSLSDPFNTGVYPAGAYTLRQTLGNAGVDLERSISVFIETTKAIDASLSLQPQRVSAGVETQMEATMNLTNAGNVALEDETIIIEVFNKDNEEVVQSEEILISIPLAEQITEIKILTVNLVEGNYEIRLKYLEEILASADLVAAAALKPEKGVGLHPRVLVMDLGDHERREKHEKKGKHGNEGNSELAFVTGLLQSQGIEYDVGQRLLNSFVKLHKGHSNVNIVLGHALGRKLRDELRERVWRGEGLIFICDKPMNTHEWMDFLGVKIKSLPGKDRENHITLLPCPLGSGGKVELVKRNHLGLEKVLEDVTIIAQTQQQKHPVMALRKYGNGYVLVSVVPLEFKSGVAEMSQLLVSAVNHFSNDVYNRSDLTRIIPVELVLTNESLNEETITVKEILPYGVETYDYTPEPEEGEELKWTLTIPAAGEEKVSYWLKLPDQIGSYEVKTELYKGETKLEDVSLTFDVAQEVLSRIDELIVELESVDVSGKDAQLVRKAVHRLQKVRSRLAESILQLLANAFDTLQATDYLGKVRTADVSSQRLKVQDIMVILGRRLYEKVMQWGASGLNPFIKIITSD